MMKETIEITGCGSELQGVGRLSDGRAVFVPFALPGETVEAEITQSRDRFALARLTRVVSPSPQRVPPLCPYYQTCGGCQIQHAAFGLSAQLKRSKVYDALTRLGGLSNPDVRQTLTAPAPFGYRNKAEFAFAPDAAGVYQGGSHRVIDISACPLQTDNANLVFRFVKAHRGKLPLRFLVTRVNAAGEMMVTLSLGAPVDAAALAKTLLREFPFVRSVYSCRLALRPAHALDGPCTLLAGDETLTETLCGLHFSVSPRSFFQVNRAQTEALYGAALACANLTSEDRVADVYCGAGTISLAAARFCQQVTGIEIVPDAVRDAKNNARANGLDGKTRFLLGDAAQIYPRLHNSERFRVVFVDPPRKGLDPAVTAALSAAPAPRLVYISCNPATLARDIKLLTQNAYRLDFAQPIDMFPQTEHVETIVLLQKKIS